jgi:hypothetical protein
VPMKSLFFREQLYVAEHHLHLEREKSCSLERRKEGGET